MSLCSCVATPSRRPPLINSDATFAQFSRHIFGSVWDRQTTFTAKILRNATEMKMRIMLSCAQASAIPDRQRRDASLGMGLAMIIWLENYFDSFICFHTSHMFTFSQTKLYAFALQEKTMHACGVTPDWLFNLYELCADLHCSVQSFTHVRVEIAPYRPLESAPYRSTNYRSARKTERKTPELQGGHIETY